MRRIGRRSESVKRPVVAPARRNALHLQRPLGRGGGRGHRGDDDKYGHDRQNQTQLPFRPQWIEA